MLSPFVLLLLPCPLDVPCHTTGAIDPRLTTNPNKFIQICLSNTHSVAGSTGRLVRSVRVRTWCVDVRHPDRISIDTTTNVQRLDLFVRDSDSLTWISSLDSRVENFGVLDKPNRLSIFDGIGPVVGPLLTLYTYLARTFFYLLIF